MLSLILVDTQVFAAIVDRKRSFLEQQEWKDIPWTSHQKIPVALIEDLLCDIPGLFDDVKNETISRYDIGNKVSQLSRQAAVLRWEWERNYPWCCLEIAPSPVSYLGDQPVFKSVLSFTNEDRAIETVYFDMLQLLLLEVLQACGLADQELEVITATGPSTNASLSPGLPPNFEGGEPFALEMCQCVDYLSRGKQQGMNAFVLQFPLAVAQGVMKHHALVDAWLVSIMGKG